MKKGLLYLLFAWGWMPVGAQRPSELSLPDTLAAPEAFVRPDSLRRAVGEMPDSIVRQLPWSAQEADRNRRLAVRPAVTMTSIEAIPRRALPSRVTVLNDNTLRLGPHFTLSNGQAANWGPFPDAYLDARTLSFPLPH